MPDLQNTRTPTITVNDGRGPHAPDPAPQYYKYEGDGLVPVDDSKDDLGDLLRDYQVEEGEDGPFWTDKLLRHILTRPRIKTQLRLHFDSHKADTFVDQIHPKAKDSSSRTYLKIFAILLLIERPGDIGKFIDEGLCDQMLPVEIKRKEVLLVNEPNRRLRCFEKWRNKDKESFESCQWKVNTPYFGSKKDLASNEFHFRPSTKKPWRKSPSREPESTIEITENAGAYGAVSRVEIHPTAHSYQKLLTGVRTIDSSSTHRVTEADKNGQD
ncbi:hypothetical protein IL306_005572 [Fusarium sp. DS 682]|nr:hypothetical protein IL306_005572 [Fusarium sp. DS 682]